MQNLKIISNLPIRMSMGICLGAVVLSYNLVCLSQVANLVQIKNHLTDDQLVFQLSLATSLFNFGTLISNFLLIYKYVNWIGQLRGLLLIDIIGIICISVQLIDLNFINLAITRFILGLLIGISTGIIPVYINSIAPSKISGKIGTFNQLFQVFGVLFAYIMGFMLNDKDQGDQIRWRLFIGFPILGFIGRIIILQVFYPYDSIERLIKLGNTVKLKQFCTKVYENPQQAVDILVQNKQIQTQSHSHQSTKNRRLLIALIIIASNQMAGINGILYYAKQLFNKITNNQATLTQVLLVSLAIFQIIATLISSQIVDRKGRKPMLLYGYILLIGILGGIFVSDILITKINDGFGQTLVIILIFVHILVFNMTLGPICIIYCTQIISDITWVIITLKACALLMALGTQYMIQYLGIGFMFLIFGVITLIIYLFLRNRIIQTKSKTAKQIYPLFEVKKKQFKNLLNDKNQENDDAIQFQDAQQEKI